MFSLPSLILLVSALCTGLLAGYTWHHRSIGPATRYAALLFGAMTLYVGGYGIELLAPDLETAVVWVRIEYLGIAVIPPLLLGMILEYTGYGRLLTRPAVIVLFIIPAVTLVSVFLLHPLYYASIGFDTSGPLPRVVLTAGPLYLVHTVYLLTALVVSASALVLTLQRSTQPLYRRQTLVMLVGTVVPFATFLVYLTNLSPIPHLDLTAFALPVTALTFTIGVARFRLFGLGPVGHSTVVERIPIGVLVVDDRRQVIEANAAATALLGTGTSPIGRTLDEAAARLPELPGLVDAADDSETELSDADRYLLVSVAPLADRPGQVGGKVVLIRDITSRRRAEEALAKRTADLEAANRRLSLLSAITRHDIANQLVVIDGYLTLLREEPRGPDAPTQVERLAAAVDRVRAMVRFMRDYPAIGAQAPAWLGLRETAERAIRSVGLGGVAVENRLPELAVFVDPLFERVFSTLIENAVRHGGPVTRIRLEAAPVAAGLLVAVEDDGVGVAAADKARIFEQGIGRNTGLGLFLASEILDSMGMGIVETGVPDEGARFEILIPAERLRQGREGTRTP